VQHRDVYVNHFFFLRQQKYVYAISNGFYSEMHGFDFMLLFIVGFWIILIGGFLLKKIIPCTTFISKCFCRQLIGNSQAYQSLGVK